MISISSGLTNVVASAWEYMFIAQFPQSEKFNGVRTTAKIVAIAVRLTDKATLAFEREEIKLEKFPPGQAATNIIPKAMVGVKKSFKITTIKKVRKGNTKNWDTTPITADFGLLIKSLN